ncbi:hypothetical protein [Gillisia sp. CAL575]|uniref:hypothetical protein n=1 Tax=Gillisia sp. CAL575 TaxID=985255 RepID=UPI0003A7A917|nr:hypothetical protein [Gillisia sp. CAL575]
MKLIFIILGLLFTTNGYSQTDKEKYYADLTKLDSLNQINLSTGNKMLDTEKKYYAKIDSLRINIYNDLNSEKPNENGCLEQKVWVNKRIKMTDSLRNEFKENSDFSNDREMFLYFELIKFTRARIDCLLQ